MTAPDAAARAPDERVWEPWVPTVGQRVRASLNGECPAGHPRQIHGAIGVVADPTKYPNAPMAQYPGHRYVILWDVPFRRDDGATVKGSLMCAAELEPVEDTAR
jgi:FtsP/CotA-like multicopper oxidase with cupredoxin domain